jgi:NAD+ kinase
MTKTVGLLAKSGSREIASTAKKLYQTIQRQGLSVVPDENLARTHRLPGGKPLSKINTDLLVTVGGDGTVLKAVREMPNHRMPILGVNMGRRGYLTEVDPSGFEEALSRWTGGEFQLEKLWKLSASYAGKTIGEGLNEALLTPAVPAKMLSLEISLRGRSFYSARADGLVVATPTGSTAHAFSAGGPVLESSLDNFALAFIAPLQPVRSIVVPVDAGLHVTVGRPGPDANLSLDGLLRGPVKPGQTVSFRKSSNSSFFVRFDDTFLQRSLRRLSPERVPV